MAETANMLSANPFLQKNMPKLPGNVGIGYAQGGLNAGTQAKASDSLGVEKQEGKISQGALDAAKAELARNQSILQQKQADKAMKETERSQMQGQAQSAQASAQAAAQAAQSAQDEVGRAKSELQARNEQNAWIRANGPATPATPPSPGPSGYTGQYSPTVAPPPPPTTVSFGSPPSTGNSGSATSALQAAARNTPQGYDPKSPQTAPSNGNTYNSGINSAMSAISSAIKEAQRQEEIRKGLRPPDAPTFSSGRR